MMPIDNSPRLYQIDRGEKAGLIIHSYGVAGETIAPKPGEPPLTWNEAHLILLDGVVEQKVSPPVYSRSYPEESPVSANPASASA